MAAKKSSKKVASTKKTKKIAAKATHRDIAKDESARENGADLGPNVSGLKLVGFIAVTSAQRRMESYPIVAGDDGSKALEKLARRMTEMNPAKDWQSYGAWLGDDNELRVKPIELRPVAIG